MPSRWQGEELEVLEAISQDEEMLRLCLRMARLEQNGHLGPFLAELATDDDVDPETTAAFAELATDARFLHALEDYVARTRQLH